MIKPYLSVVFPTFHENMNAINTARSIRETAGDEVQILCVDDGSQDEPVEFPKDLNVTLVKTRQRIGSGPARHLGVMSALGTHVLQCDTHCLFTPGWYESLTNVAFLPERNKTVHCASMVALDRDHPALDNHNGHYFGATFKFCKDGKVLEAVWQDAQHGDDYQIPAVMGSAYCYTRHWYLRLNPHRYLRSWGLEEEALALKCWLFGGEVRLLKTVEIGHIFRTAKDRVPYEIRHWDVFYNRLFLILTCLPETHHLRFMQAFGRQDAQFQKAMTQIKEDAHLIEIERITNDLFMTQTFDWFCEKFGL